MLVTGGESGRGVGVIGDAFVVFIVVGALALFALAGVFVSAALLHLLVDFAAAGWEWAA